MTECLVFSCHKISASPFVLRFVNSASQLLYFCFMQMHVNGISSFVAMESDCSAPGGRRDRQTKKAAPRRRNLFHLK